MVNAEPARARTSPPVSQAAVAGDVPGPGSLRRKASEAVAFRMAEASAAAEEREAKAKGCATAVTLRKAGQRIEIGLVERGAEAKLLLLALCAGEHLLLLGPPGTAKVSKRVGAQSYLATFGQ